MQHLRITYRTGQNGTQTAAKVAGVAVITIIAHVAVHQQQRGRLRIIASVYADDVAATPCRRKRYCLPTTTNVPSVV